MKIKTNDLSYHPLNLTLRFILELVCLFSAGFWGWSREWYPYILAPVIPLLMMLSWSFFAVPGDRSRSGNAPVPIPGALRILLELSFFGFGTWAFFDLGKVYFGLIFGAIVALHYLISYKRLSWLMKQ